MKKQARTVKKNRSCGDWVCLLGLWATGCVCSLRLILVTCRKDLLEPTPREDLQEMLRVVSEELKSLAGDALCLLTQFCTASGCM